MPRPGVPSTAVVFDFDGTLVDSNRVKDETFIEVATSRPGGREVMTEVRATPGLDRHGIFALFAARLGLGAGEAAELVGTFSDLVDRRVAEAPAIAGAVELLDALSENGIPCHLSSATPLASLVPIVAQRGWTTRFRSLHGRPDDKVTSLRCILDMHGLSDPTLVTVVGDGIDDLECARRMGCRFFGVGDRRELAEMTPLLSLDRVRHRLLDPEGHTYD